MDTVAVHVEPEAAGRGRIGIPQRWFLVAVLIVGAMVPWYTLRLFPIFTVGTVAAGNANVNALDILAACAVLTALPAILKGALTARREFLWVIAFIAYMGIPLAVGLQSSQSAFFAIREFRAFPFYALALAFASGGYGPRDFRAFSTFYVAGALVTIVAVFVHTNGHMPLPGYPEPDHIGVIYLEWSVPLVAFMLTLAGALTASSLWKRALWTSFCIIVAWYVLATAERFMQFVALVTSIVVLNLRTFGGPKFRRLAIIMAALAILLMLATGVLSGPAWLSARAHTALVRWTRAFTDNTLRFHYREVREGLPHFFAHPIIGEGLGGPIRPEDPNHPGQPWPYIALGYGVILIKTGLVGTVLYLGMVWSALRRGFMKMRASTDHGEWPAPLIGTLGIGLLLGLNVLYPSVDTPEGAIAFSLFYGMILAPQFPGSGANG